MKKIILGFMFLLSFLFIFWIVNAVLPEDPCLNNPNLEGCVWWDALQARCTNAWWVYEWIWEDCMCILFFGTPAQMPIQSCASVPTEEELELNINNCVWWELLKDWTCCPDWSYPYDPSWLFWWWEQYTKCCNWTLYDNDKKCCEKWAWIRKADWDECLLCSTQEAKTLPGYQNYCSDDISSCNWEMYLSYDWTSKCCIWMVVADMEHDWFQTCIVNTEWSMWINMDSDCLLNWQCSYNIYETLWIRKSDQNPKVSSFMQDIVLAATTFIGTVIAIILVVSGVLYIVAAIWWNSSLADTAKKWLINSVVWLLLVVWSYAIIRLIQFLATAWGW